MIQLKNVSKFYSSKGMITSGLSKINLELNRGEFVVITGESGSGKSTLLNVISGLDSYEEGDMLVEGNSTSHYMATDFEIYRKKYIGNIFQNFNLINSYTVYENVELVLRINGYSRAEMKKITNSIINRVGLEAFRNTKASKLSGGQKQRVAIARALARQTDIIVADEPTGNLDSKAASEIAALLSEIAKDRLVIVVTHNFDQFAEYATRIIKMHDGRIVENTSLARETVGVEAPTTSEDEKKSKISPLSILRLGLRNTFNIPYKFILLLLVFSFLVIATAGMYTSYVFDKETSKDSVFSTVFPNYSKYRIVVTKNDKSPIDDNELAALGKLNNINKVEPNDMLLDTTVNLAKGDFEFSAYPKAIEGFAEKLDAGKMPEAPNEVVLAGVDDKYVFTKKNVNNIIGNSYKILYGNDNTMTIKVSGIRFYTDKNASSFEGDIFLTEKAMADMRRDVYYNISKVETRINDKIQICDEGSTFYGLVPSEKVKDGTAIVTADADGFYSKGGVKNKTISTKVENIYFKENKDFKVVDTYTEKTFGKKTGRKDYEDYGSSIFISPADYNSIFRKGNYQVSLYMADDGLASETRELLKKKGYEPIVLKEAVSSDGTNINQVIKAPLMVIMLVGLIFITYFVTRLILKSRKDYFSVLRMLGLAKGSIRNILNVEMFTIISISYGIFICITQLSIRQIIPMEQMAKLVEYMTPRDYVVLFIMVELMALFISTRFAGKLFRNTAIGSFREEE